MTRLFQLIITALGGNTLFAIGFGATSLLFGSLFLNQCHTTNVTEDERDSIQVAYIRLGVKYDAVRDTNSNLIRLVFSLNKEIAGYKEQITSGELSAAQAQEKIRQAIGEKRLAIARMNEYQQKIAVLNVAFKNGDITADRLRDSLNRMPIFTEAQANEKYLQLSAERDAWRDSTKVVYEQVGRLQVANKNLKDDQINTTIAIGTLRTKVQNKRTKASKGFVKQIVNAGKISALGEIDSDLEKILNESHK